MSSPVASIRLNPFKGSDGPEGTGVPWSEHGRILPSRPSFTLDPLFHAGCYYVQDASSMYVGHIFRKLTAGLGGNLRVLDLCAAPGGKTTDIAASLRERFSDDFELTSNEVMRQRASVLSTNVALWGDGRIAVTSLDPAVFGRRLRSYYDVIVADVPCSGEGMFRKDPSAKEQWSEDLVELCAARQKRIIADVWPALKPGGLLIYSTCTYSEKENDLNLEWIASSLGGEIVPAENEFASLGVRLTRRGNLLVAGEVPGEGQWVGAVVKNMNGDGAAVHAGSLKDIPVIRSGVRKGEWKGKDFIPDADYALSLSYGREYPEVELTLEQALSFLHRDTLTLREAPPGFLCVCFKSHPLGFVKNLGSRCNNLLPRERRILMDV